MVHTQPPIDEEVAVDEHDPHLYRNHSLAQSIPSFADIGPEHLTFFHQHGYLAINQAFSSAQIDAASNALYDLIDGKNPEFRGLQMEAHARGTELTDSDRRLAVRKLMNFVDYDPRFQALAVDADLLQALELLMDDEPIIFQEMALLKPPGGREKPWHQDCAYFNYPLDTTVIGVWISLDHATPENGCLHIMPGTHNEGPVNHFKQRDWQICDTEVQQERDVIVPLAPGGCLLWHGMLHHGSPCNQSQQPRRALQLHYQPANAGQIETEERMQHFGGEVRGAEC